MMTDETDDAKSNQREEEAPDEWSALADSYASAFVPSFAPIYNVVADLIGNKVKGATTKVLDFGCGPGEPAITIAKRFASIELVAVDSTQPMLDIAAKRVKEQEEVYDRTLSAKRAKQGISDRIRFHHVRRDVSMKELVDATGDRFDAIVSTFTMHYFDFARRVEIVSQFLKMAPDVWLVAWGDQNKVGFLRAIKTFAMWKGGTIKNICRLSMDPEDNGEIESPIGSFTMCRREVFQGIVDQAEGSQLAMFDTKVITIHFASVKALLSFLPMSVNKNDIEVMWKLLKSWGADHVALGDGPDQTISFPVDVVFCQISRLSKADDDSTK